tara:strand:- start:560 stop:994 length:435 start_codon:yes stop_codon:yes gene_type:complete
MTGRPIEYNEGLIEKTKQYLDLCEDEIMEYHKTRGDNSNSFERIINVKLPSIEGLALYLGIHKDTIYDWCKKYPNFSDVIDQLRAKQAQTLINKGLSGDYNSTIAKVLLTKHGYREGMDVVTEERKFSPSTEDLAKVNAALDGQ